ncbi:GAF domain-containing protein [Myxococcota bacterium]|nr:GAF domain-containing protein [Myxococcota bacterium]
MNMKNVNSFNNRIYNLFEEGKRFTEELLTENEKLRMTVVSLQSKKAELGANDKDVKPDIPRMEKEIDVLVSENHQLMLENEELKTRFRSVEAENRDFADRYVQVERQNSDLINMYVAGYRLHSTLKYDEVLKICKEIVINMVGAEKFAFYLADGSGKDFVRVAEEGFPENATSRDFEDLDLVHRVLQSGELFTIDDENLLEHDGSAPIACVPLKVGDEILGVIAIHQLLLQKEGFGDLDFELFELLGGHAATAIYSSTLYSRSERKRNTLQSFIDMLKDQSGAEAQTA